MRGSVPSADVALSKLHLSVHDAHVDSSRSGASEGVAPYKSERDEGQTEECDADFVARLSETGEDAADVSDRVLWEGFVEENCGLGTAVDVFGLLWDFRQARV